MLILNVTVCASSQKLSLFLFLKSKRFSQKATLRVNYVNGMQRTSFSTEIGHFRVIVKIPGAPLSKRDLARAVASSFVFQIALFKLCRFYSLSQMRREVSLKSSPVFFFYDERCMLFLHDSPFMTRGQGTQDKCFLTVLSRSVLTCYNPFRNRGIPNKNTKPSEDRSDKTEPTYP